MTTTTLNVLPDNKSISAPFVANSGKSPQQEIKWVPRKGDGTIFDCTVVTDVVLTVNSNPSSKYGIMVYNGLTTFTGDETGLAATIPALVMAQGLTTCGVTSLPYTITCGNSNGDTIVVGKGVINYSIQP